MSRPPAGPFREAWDFFVLRNGLRPVLLSCGPAGFVIRYYDPATGCLRSEAYPREWPGRLRSDLQEGRRFCSRVLLAARAHRRAERGIIERAIAAAEREMAEYSFKPAR